MRLSGGSFILALVLQVAAPQQSGTVEGVVVDAITDQPLSRATVQLRGSGDTKYLLVGDTRADGSFAFRNVPPGTYQIEALRSGYIPGIYGERAETTPSIPRIAPGQVLSAIRIALTPSGVISGRLTDDRGEPVGGATVEALKTTFKDGERQRTVAQTVATNDLGDYRIFMLPPGEYYIRARLRGSVLDSLFSELRGVPVYFPGTIDMMEARRIDLRAGEVVGGIDLPAFPTKSLRVTGNVVGMDAETTAVLLSPRNETHAITGNVDPGTGAFEFKDVLPGSYMLVAKSYSRSSAIPLEVRNADVLNYSVPLGAEYEVPVRVRIDGHPVGDDPDLERLYFVLQPDTPIGGLAVETYSPFPDGHLTLTTIAGSYRVRLTRPEDYYIRSMTIGGSDVLSQGLQVNGSTDVPLQIVVASNLGSVEGRVSGTGVTVVLVPSPNRRGQSDFYRWANAAASGEFRMDKVPPGDYKLFAWVAENGGPWRDPEYVARYEDRGIAVHVEEGTRVRVSQMVAPLD